MTSSGDRVPLSRLSGLTSESRQQLREYGVGNVFEFLSLVKTSREPTRSLLQLTEEELESLVEQGESLLTEDELSTLHRPAPQRSYGVLPPDDWDG